MAESVIGTLVYRITGDSTALERSLDTSSRKISKTGESLAKLGQRARQVGTVVFSGVFVKSLLEASSRVEELGSKFDTVFDGMESRADEWARRYADDTNRGVTATKEFLATQQDLRTGYGDTVEAAMRYSQAVVGVTNDLASFSNVPVEDAMAAVNSGLTGQFDALKRLGVGLNANIINQSEYAKSIGRTWEEMDNLQRQEAVLSGIMAQSKNAIHQNVQVWTDYDYTLGDAALTSDSFANSTQGLSQRLDDLKAELGDSLMPAATSIVGIASDAVKWFNSWDDTAQRLATSLVACGAAVAGIGGPVGAVVGVLGGLLIAVSGNSDAVERLSDAASALVETSDEYRTIASRLSEDTDTLSKSERALYEIQMKRLKLEMDQKMLSVASSYDDASKKVAKYSSEEAKAQGRLEATLLVIEGLNSGSLEAAKARYDELEALAKAGRRLSDEESAAWSQLAGLLPSAAEALALGGQDLQDQLTELGDSYEFLFKKVGDSTRTASTESLNLEESLLQLSIAYRNGTLDLDAYERLYPELVTRIKEGADALQEESSAVDGHSEAVQAAISAGRQWRDLREQQLADLAQESGDYRKAAELRISLIKKEEEQQLHALAVSSGVIKEEETLSKERLEAALKESEDFAAEYAALQQYYFAQIFEERRKESRSANDELDAQREAEEALERTRESNSQTWVERLRSQSESLRENAAAQLEASGDIEAAYSIRYALLDEERDRDLEALRVKVSSHEANEEDILRLDEYYSNERKTLAEKEASAVADARAKALDEETRKAKAAAEEQARAEDELAKARESNSKAWTDRLLEQSIAAQRNAASELEASGDLKGAYAMRIQLLDDEMQRELDAMQTLIYAREATEQDRTNLLEYYSNERKALVQQEADAEASAVEESLKTQKETWNGFVSDLKGLVSEFGSAYVDLYGSITDKAVAEIDRQTQAKLEALGIAEKSEAQRLRDEYDAAVESGDMKLAKEKQDSLQRLQIEEEAEQRKAKLQREQAERERDLRIFTTTLDMLSAVVKYLADPGGLAGIGLSAMAATTGAMQIAAIKAEALPSFDVGANYVPEDMLAVVHQGETILPAPMAESVRRGDAVFGDSGCANVQVTIINNTSAEVSAQEVGTDEQREVRITIGKVVESQIGSGRFDSALGRRYGIRRVGRNA